MSLSAEKPAGSLRVIVLSPWASGGGSHWRNGIHLPVHGQERFHLFRSLLPFHDVRSSRCTSLTHLLQCVPKCLAPLDAALFLFHIWVVYCGHVEVQQILQRLCPAALVNSFITARGVLVDSLGFPICKVMSYQYLKVSQLLPVCAARIESQWFPGLWDGGRAEEQSNHWGF